MRVARSSIVGFSNMMFGEMREIALRVLEFGDVRKALTSWFRKYVTLKLRNGSGPKRVYQSRKHTCRNPERRDP